MSSEYIEQLRLIARSAVIPILGALTVESLRISQNVVRHRSYWPASQDVWLELVKHGAGQSIRFAGKVIHGDSLEEVIDVQAVEIIPPDYTDEQIIELVQSFAENDA